MDVEQSKNNSDVIQPIIEKRPFGRRNIFFFVGLVFVAAVYLILANILDLKLMEHSDYDSYTLQALRWREGFIALAQNYSWLEIAQYNGQFFISFPPFPAIPMLVLTYFFNSNTPSMLVSAVYFILSYCAGYGLAKRFCTSSLTCSALSAFLVLGCNMLEVAQFGGVWNMAQILGFCMILTAFFCVTSNRKAMWVLALTAFAFAVGCRPLQAIYLPLFLYLMYKNTGKAIFKMIPYLIIPACIAALYCVYNYIRFDNIFEFGHNYLPEFVESENGQFSTAYMIDNIRNILRLPYIENGMLLFPKFSGFAFFIANPMFIIFAIRFVESCIRGKKIALQPLTAETIEINERRSRYDTGVYELLTILLFCIHFFVLLMHKSFGGWQFGTRYLCDLVPSMFLFICMKHRKIRVVEGIIMAAAVAFNFYGAIIFHLVLSV